MNNYVASAATGDGGSSAIVCVAVAPGATEDATSAGDGDDTCTALPKQQAVAYWHRVCV